MRLLDREADIETRYGGGFVQSINGIAGAVDAGRSSDWFFYVNGVESSVGAAEVPLRAGDRIWWDYRDWTAAMRVPAVVGSWPEPFAQEAEAADARLPVRVECATARQLCDEAVAALADEGGVEASVVSARSDAKGPEAERMLVGEWDRIRSIPPAELLAGGPGISGVFARFQRDGTGWALEGLDASGGATPRASGRFGLVAALRDGEDPPVWLVTGTDEQGVSGAVEQLDDSALEDRYALAVQGSDVVPLPVGAAG